MNHNEFSTTKWRIHYDSSFQSNCEDKIKEIQAVVSKIQHFFQTPPQIHSSEELAAWECEVEKITGQLAGLLVGHAIQKSLESVKMRDEVLRFVDGNSRLLCFCLVTGSLGMLPMVLKKNRIQGGKIMGFPLGEHDWLSMGEQSGLSTD